VRAIVEEGVQEVVDALREFEDINAQLPRPLGGRHGGALRARPACRTHSNDECLGSRQSPGTGDGTRCAVRRATPRWPCSPVASAARVALCRLLLKEPDILLLDESHQPLDAESVAWLEKHLQQYKGTIIAVNPRRYFWTTLLMDSGTSIAAYGIPWKGNYSSWLSRNSSAWRKKPEPKARVRKTLQRELEWLHMHPEPDKAKAKARINQYYNLVGQAKERANESAKSPFHPARVWVMWSSVLKG